VGLAGPQIAILQRIFVWEVEDEHGIFINPVIKKRSRKKFTEEEGCLSLPGLVYPVQRSFSVTIEAIDEHGAPVKIDAEEHLARVFQHEIDHLDGILFIDRLPEDLKRDALRTLREQSLGLAGISTPLGDRF
jgi:peptide deformylase